MNSTPEFQPNWTSPPGDTIRSILEERGKSEMDLLPEIGCSREELENLLQGRMTISIGLARRLSATLGSSVEFWMSRDFQYREDTARIQKTNEEWLSELPLNDMIRFGWLDRAPTAAEEVRACLDFFGAPSIAACRERFLELEGAAGFRTSKSFDSNAAAVAAWLRQGERIAAQASCSRWNDERLRESLGYLRSLTKQKDPKRFLPELQECCAESGLVVAIIRAPSGCRASGAARFVSEDKALIQLSFRYLSDDQFWFTFFHEVGHLLLHSHEGVFLEGLGAGKARIEEEANQFSADLLIPPESRAKMLRLRPQTKEVIRFAVSIGLSPGIVVGQMQYLGVIDHSRLNKLKRRYAWA